jgi:hypothetical protein
MPKPEPGPTAANKMWSDKPTSIPSVVLSLTRAALADRRCDLWTLDAVFQGRLHLGVRGVGGWDHLVARVQTETLSRSRRHSMCLSG